MLVVNRAYVAHTMILGHAHLPAKVMDKGRIILVKFRSISLKARKLLFLTLVRFCEDFFLQKSTR